MSRAALAEAAARLRAAGVDNPAGDARRLLAFALGLAPERMAVPPDRLAPEEAARFAAAVAARAARRPLAQITGERLFFGRSFRVTADTLDPRPETELLVATALQAPFASVLDLGTGSGAILVSLLAERPGARGQGTDLSPAALAVARENAARHAVTADFALSDWFARVAGRFDLIVSNPPYIAEAEMAGLAPEVRDWEPHLALTPGGDGLAAYRAIAAGVGAHLAPGGRLLVEIGATQGRAVAGLLAVPGLEVVRILKDLDGHDRVVEARMTGPG